MKTNLTIHVRTMSGLEGVLAKELQALGASHVQPKSRLVVCQGDQEMIYRLNLWCRTGIRVLQRLASFSAADEKALYQGVQSIDWSQWLESAGTLAVDAQVHSSFTTHSLFLAQLTKDAIVDQIRAKNGKRPSVDLASPDLRIALRLFKNTAQIFVDSSGDSLHRRGYRPVAGEAPLSETLAAGILRLSGWTPEVPLIDGMTGSGTLAIEAGLIARNMAPGLLRKQFGFQRWPNYDAALFKKLVDEAIEAETSSNALITGVELDSRTADLARANVERAGLSDQVRIVAGDFFIWQNPAEGPGVVVMNPPYDERLQVEDINLLWKKIGKRLHDAYKGWSAFLLCGNPLAAEQIGLRSSDYFDVNNGPIACRLFRYDLTERGARLTDDKGASPARIPKLWRDKAEMFGNRLRKNAKHLAKQARREGLSSYRLYDWDIPDLPFVVDREGEEIQMSEIPRNLTHSVRDHEHYLKLIVQQTSEALGVPATHVTLKPGRVSKKIQRPEGAAGA